MSPYERHAAALKSVQTRLGPSVVTWDGDDLPIVPGTATRRKDLGAGGFSLNADMRFEALASCWGYDDASNLKTDMLQTVVVYLGDNYKVESVGIRPGALQIVVECNSVGQDA